MKYRIVFYRITPIDANEKYWQCRMYSDDASNDIIASISPPYGAYFQSYGDAIRVITRMQTEEGRHGGAGFIVLNHLGVVLEEGEVSSSNVEST